MKRKLPRYISSRHLRAQLLAAERRLDLIASEAQDCVAAFVDPEDDWAAQRFNAIRRLAEEDY